MAVSLRIRATEHTIISFYVYVLMIFIYENYVEIAKSNQIRDL